MSAPATTTGSKRSWPPSSTQDGLIAGKPARRRLWHDAIVQRRQEHGDEAKQIEMRMRRHQHEILPYAHDNAEDNADQAQ